MTDSTGSIRRRAALFILILPVDQPPGQLSLRSPGRVAWQWWLAPGPHVEGHATGVTMSCESCGQQVGSCSHTRLELLVPLLASFVFPGLGALLQGNLAQARVTMLVALGFLLEIARVALPQHLGTLPPNAAAWLTPLGGYVSTAFVAAFSMFIAWWRARRRVNVVTTRGVS